jgi:RNA polymerase sigma factor (TIGR02999 family)
MPRERAQTELRHDRTGTEDGDELDRLMAGLYAHLRQLAHHRLAAAPREHSLNTTGLVHEAYLRLTEAHRATPFSRTEFLALASRVMRNVLVDRARARCAHKRGRGHIAAPLTDDVPAGTIDIDVVLDLDAALTQLAEIDPRQSALIELHYFGALSLDESAEVMGLSLATVKRILRRARAWLAVALGGSRRD